MHPTYRQNNEMLLWRL